MKTGLPNVFQMLNELYDVGILKNGHWLACIMEAPTERCGKWVAVHMYNNNILGDHDLQVQQTEEIKTFDMKECRHVFFYIGNNPQRIPVLKRLEELTGEKFSYEKFHHKIPPYD